MKLKPIDASQHNLLRIDFIDADALFITDYNAANAESYIRKQVLPIGEYSPKWNELKSKKASIDLKFNQAFNNLKKLRC